MAKKDFSNIESPAMQFLSKREEPVKTQEKQAPEGYKINPEYIETKSKRLQLLIQPSLHEALKARALSEETSVNNLIHTILEKAVK